MLLKAYHSIGTIDKNSFALNIQIKENLNFIHWTKYQLFLIIQHGILARYLFSEFDYDNKYFKTVEGRKENIYFLNFFETF